MSRSFNYLGLLGPQIRRMSTRVAQNPRSLYDSLGVSSKATQADIKSAYYALSKVYHPDRNKDSEDAAQKFRKITEAYEVLGNVRSRKLYDRGLYLGNYEDKPRDETVNKFYQSRDTKSRPPAYGRTTVYDFDEWSRSHYGATFARDMRNKERARILKRREDQAVHDIKSEKVIWLLGIIIMFMGYIFYERDYDVDSYKNVGGIDIIVTRPKS